MAQHLKDWIDVSAACLAPWTAALAILLAWRQWQTDRSRLRHELYERRWAVYEKIAGFMARVLQHKKNAAGAMDLLRETRESYFLFDERIQAFIGEVYRHGCDLASLEASYARLAQAPGPHSGRTWSGSARNPNGSARRSGGSSRALRNTCGSTVGLGSGVFSGVNCYASGLGPAKVDFRPR